LDHRSATSPGRQPSVECLPVQGNGEIRVARGIKRGRSFEQADAAVRRQLGSECSDFGQEVSLAPAIDRRPASRQSLFPFGFGHAPSFAAAMTFGCEAGLTRMRCPQNDEGGGMATVGTTVSSVRSADGTTLALQRSGAGPALILVDAAGHYREFSSFGGLMDLLVADFTVFTYDRRGRGGSSDTQPYSVEREVADLAALIDEAGGSAYVYGVSSGASLALHAAASGLPIRKLALFEPPIGTDEDREAGHKFTAELAELIAAGRHGDAVEYFHTGIGVPAEIVAGLRQAPFWPALESVAHTLVYDCVLSDATSLELAASVTVPTLVIDSEGTTGELTGWAAAILEALPHGSHRSLAGEWHGVPDDELALVLVDFFRS
jgi:pimeloyl-ACP methyl ester carboxylesterase